MLSVMRRKRLVKNRADELFKRGVVDFEEAHPNTPPVALDTPVPFDWNSLDPSLLEGLGLVVSPPAAPPSEA